MDYTRPITRGLGKATIQLIESCHDLLREIQPASVRAVAYALFVRELIPDMSRRSVARVSRGLVTAREHGLIPWQWIVDEHRAVEQVASWEHPDALIRQAVKQYRRDNWSDQPYRVELWSEKGSVRGTLAPILDEFGIALRVHHGYTSATVAADIARQSQADRRPMVALYVGDFDPSGLNMSEVDLPERIHRYGGTVEIRRIALLDHDTHALPGFDVATKKADPRYRWYRERFGRTAWELDAMPPPQLRARVQTEIERLIDWPLWERAQEIESAELASMQDFLAHHWPRAHTLAAQGGVRE